MTPPAFTKIIVGYESSPGSRDALELGRLLADATAAELVVASIYPPPPAPWALQPHAELMQREALAAADASLADARRRLRPAWKTSFCAHEGQSPVHGLHTLAEAEDADLIVVGSTRRGAFGRVTVGGVGERLLHAAPCAVAVAPHGFAEQGDPGLRVIGVAYDGSPGAKRALAIAGRLAAELRATVRILGVLEPAPVVSGGYMAAPAYGDLQVRVRQAFRDELQSAAESLPDGVRPSFVMATGTPAEEIVKRAETLDLLVVGSRGYGPVRRLILGSVSASLAHTSPCPLLIAPRGAEAPHLEPELHGSAASG